MADAESPDGTYLTGRSESNGTFKRGGWEAWNEGDKIARPPLASYGGQAAANSTEAAGLNWSGDVRSCETGRLTSARCRLFASVTPLDFVYRKQLPTIRLLHNVTSGMLLLSSKTRSSHACSSALARSRRHTCVNPRSGSMLTCPFANRARTSAGSSGGRS
jgi:hypothetical protein